MATMTYVVNKDWAALQELDPATYEGSAQEWIYSVDAFASIYKTVKDGNNIKIPGAVNPGSDTDPASPIPLNGEGAPVVINVINGDFHEDVVAAANANYTLEFSSIYTFETRPDLNTTFVGSFESKPESNVGFRISAAGIIDPTKTSIVNFGKANTNRTTITLNRTDTANKWGKDTTFTVGGDFLSDYTAKEQEDKAFAKATAIVTNTDLTVNGAVWVGSGWTDDGSAEELFEKSTDDVRYFLTIDDSLVNTASIQVRNTGNLTVTGSTVNTVDASFRHDASFTNTDLTVKAGAGNFNVYGETDVTAKVTLTNSTLATDRADFTIGKEGKEKRKGVVKLVSSKITGITTSTPGAQEGDDPIITVAKADITVNVGGTLDIDAASKVDADDVVNKGNIKIAVNAAGEDWIQAGTFTNTAGTLTIDTSALANDWEGVKRVVYAQNADNTGVDLAKVVVAEGYSKATRKGKVAIAKGIDYTTLYVSNAINEDDDFAKTWPSQEPKDYYVDFNAFGLAKSTMESQVENVTTTILIDGTNAAALDYAGETTASIDGLTFKKDGTNAVVNDPASVEQDVTFALTGMDFRKANDLRTLMKGIRVEEGVVFSADKMYQRGAEAVTTINGTLLIKEYTIPAVPAVPDDPETTGVDESKVTVGDNFMIAGGKVEVTETGSLIGGGTISANATNRFLEDFTDVKGIYGEPGKVFKEGDAIPAILSIKVNQNQIGVKPEGVTPEKNLTLVIGSNASVTIEGTIGTDDKGTKEDTSDDEENVVISKDVYFQNIIMRQKTQDDFKNPVLNVRNARVQVADAFDTAMGTININFQSQLFVNANVTIAGGTINLSVSQEDIEVLKSDDAKMLYTIVRAPLQDAVELTCDVESTEPSTPNQIADTKYIYTSRGGRGLFVMHEDLATNLYVNAAWTDSDTKTYQFGEEVIKGKAYYGINAFNSFIEALTVTQKTIEDETIYLCSNVAETYNNDLFYKDSDDKPITFKGSLTVTSYKDQEAGYTGAYTATLTNTFPAENKRMDLCLGPEAGKSMTFDNNVTFVMTDKDDTHLSGSGIWFGWGGAEGATTTVKSDVTASYIGFNGKVYVTNDATLTSAKGDIQISGAKADVTITGTYDPASETAPVAQVTSQGFQFVNGSLTVVDSFLTTNYLGYTDDWDRTNYGGFNSTVTVNVTDSRWDAQYLTVKFYTPVGDNLKASAELTFTESELNVSHTFVNVPYETTSGTDTGTTPLNVPAVDFVFKGSTLTVGTEATDTEKAGALSNSGTIKLTAQTIASENEEEDPTVIRSTATVNGKVDNKSKGEVLVSNSSLTVTAGGLTNQGKIEVADGGILDVQGNYYAIDNRYTTANLIVSGGTIHSTVNAVGLYNEQGATLELKNATLELKNNNIFNNTGSIIKIKGDVLFKQDVVDQDVTTKEDVTGSIKNFWKNGDVLYESFVEFGVSNTGKANGGADVDVNITGGTVMFSENNLTFDWAVTGVSATADTAEQIVSAKLFGSTVGAGATLFANKKGLTLTDSGFDVVVVEDNPTTTENETQTRTVYNNTVAITVAANSDLTLDTKIVDKEVTLVNWSVTSLTIEAASAEVTGSTAGTLKMDWRQILTVADDLDNVKGTILIDVDSFDGILANDKLLIDQTNADMSLDKYAKFIRTSDLTENENVNMGWFKLGTGENAGDLYLNAAAFAKVSQGSNSNPETGWYKRFNTVPVPEEGNPNDYMGAADSQSPVILVLDGTFTDGAYLNGKQTTVVGNYKAGTETNVRDLIFKSALVAGYDVSTLDRAVSTPEKLNMKFAEGNTNLTVKAGTNAQFKSRVVGGDLVRLASDETKVNFYRVGNTNVKINGGTYSYKDKKGKGSREIIGGLAYADGPGSMAVLTGNVNLTISGGEFHGYNIYGGNWASKPVLGKNTRLDGNVNLLVDTSMQEIVLTHDGDSSEGGSIFAGSLGHSTITGDTVVTLKGENKIVGNTLWGGCTGDYTTKAGGKIETFVEGDRILSFTGFSGGMDFRTIKNGKLIINNVDDFNKVAFSGENKVLVDTVENFEMSASFNNNVTDWTIEAGATIANFKFDFSGDTLNLTGFTDENIGQSFLGGNATVADGFESLKVTFNGGDAVAMAGDGSWKSSELGIQLNSSDWTIAAIQPIQS